MEPIAEEPVRLVPTPPVSQEDGVKKDLRPLPMPQKQFNLLTQAFKGSSSHAPSPHGRKPSVLKLSKRTESEDIQDEKSALVSFASRDEIAPSIPTERTIPTVRELPGFKSILKRTEHAIDINTIASPLHRTEPTNQIKPAESVERVPTEAQIQEQRLQDLLKSIQFHTQRDQSISTIDLKVRGEAQWLQTQPSNERWTQIVQRVSTNKTEENILTMANQNDIAERFIDTMDHHTGAVHVNNLLNGADNEKERLVVRFTFALLNDVVDELMREVSVEITSTITHASGILNKSLVKSLASVSLGMEGSSSRIWKMSGREHVLKGALLDSLRPPTVGGVEGSGGSGGSTSGGGDGAGGVGGGSVGGGISGGGSVYSGVGKSKYDKNAIQLSQPTLHSTHTKTHVPPPLYDTLLPIPPIHYTSCTEFGYDSDGSDTDEPNINTNTNTSTNNNNSTNTYSNTNTNTNNTNSNTNTTKDHITQLHNIEVAHWSGINFTSMINHPLQIPSTIATSKSNSVVSCVRVFPLSHVLYASLLVCGLCNGRVVVYVVRYTGEPAEIICTTALPIKSQQVPIVDIKCSSSGVSSIICMNILGMVSVYHINTALCSTTTTALQPVHRKKWTLFNYNTTKKSQNMANMYDIHPTDMIFTHNTLSDSINASKVDKSEYNDAVYENTQSNVTNTINTNKGIFGTNTNNNVTNANIHPTSMCFHPSITLFGNNVSFMVGANNGDIIKYNMDYVHDNMASTIIYPTTPFIQKEYIHPNNAIKGFVLTNGINEKYGNKVYRELFHYHKHKIVLLDVVNCISPYIVSVDQSGSVALWCYNSTYFEGKCWFRPYSSTKLVLTGVDLLPTGELLPHDSVVDDSGAGVDGDSGSADSGDGVGGNNDVVGTGGTTNNVSGINNTTTTIPDNIKSQLSIREMYLTNTTITTDTKSGKSSVVKGGDRIHKIYNPVYSEVYGVYVQYKSVEYDVVVTKVPVNSGHDSDTMGNGGSKDAEPPVTMTSNTTTILVPPTITFTTIPTTHIPNTTTDTTTNTTNTNTGTNNTDDPKEYSSRVMGNSLRKAAASPRVGSVRNVDSGDSGVADANSSGSTAGGSVGGHVDDVAANSIVADKVGIVTTTATSEVTVVEHANVPATASSVDENGIRVFSEAPDTTTTNSTIPNTDTNTPNTPISDTTTTAITDTPNNTYETTSTTSTTSTNNATTVPALLTPAPLLCTIEEEAEVEVAPLDDAGFTPPVLQPLVLPAHTDIPDPTNTIHTTHSTPLPIPLTIFTRITSLVEQYREHEVKVVDHFMDIDAEGSVETPVLNVDDGGGGDGSTGKGDDKELEPVAELIPVTSPPQLLTPALTPAITNNTPPISVSPVTRATPTTYTKRIIEYSQAVVLAEQTLHFTIISSKMSYDGAEVVMLLASKYNTNSTNDTNNTNNTNTTSANTNINLTVYYIMPYFPLLQRFHTHYPRLYMKSNDAIVDYSVGPLQFETLTRTVFVLTKRCVRLFSLHTGREIVTIGGGNGNSSGSSGDGYSSGSTENSNTNSGGATNTSATGTNNPINSTTNTNSTDTDNATGTNTTPNTDNNTPLPFTWTLPSFNPTSISLCPSQRVLTLSATDDARIAVYLLQHTHDGATTANTTEDSELLNRFKLFEKVRPAVKSTLPASEGTGIHTVLNIVTYIPPELQYITNEVQNILDLVFDHVWVCIEASLDHTRRKGLIDDIYSGDLGFIEPTTWPVNNTIPSLKISPRTRRHRKKREKRVKNVGSVDSVEMVTPRDDVVGSAAPVVAPGGGSDGERGVNVESEDEVSVMM